MIFDWRDYPRRSRGKGDRPSELMRGSQATRTRRARRLRDENKNCGMRKYYLLLALAGLRKELTTLLDYRLPNRGEIAGWQ